MLESVKMSSRLSPSLVDSTSDIDRDFISASALLWKALRRRYMRSVML